ncbi:MAG: hypothetical protein F6J93_24855 [Oscillatoria sp. SIO1A7]|nr:hypothetical protein [Oscillatoria sp. SIO1A7]
MFGLDGDDLQMICIGAVALENRRTNRPQPERADWAMVLELPGGSGNCLSITKGRFALSRKRSPISSSPYESKYQSIICLPWEIAFTG